MRLSDEDTYKVLPRNHVTQVQTIVNNLFNKESIIEMKTYK